MILGCTFVATCMSRLISTKFCWQISQPCSVGFTQDFDCSSTSSISKWRLSRSLQDQRVLLVASVAPCNVHQPSLTHFNPLLNFEELEGSFQGKGVVCRLESPECSPSLQWKWESYKDGDCSTHIWGKWEKSRNCFVESVVYSFP